MMPERVEQDDSLDIFTGVLLGTWYACDGDTGNPHPHDTGQRGWRVEYSLPVAGYFVIPCCFASQQDAEQALRSLRQAGVRTLQQLDALTDAELYGTMTRDLKW